ncbi:ClpXP protease specificity-enhancing factor [Legionella jordanis]|uniref:ClpXP protease specificity-enhancing factor n=1 Tax=Legionella jordanis TaxID=456 RepID=A0A0W0VBL4_9GAMM|nr:ClpXP protease specificity-enhancing factor [Legionella jordanis]KTD17532.1 ClpXP protease specificity-enhancing factor [Legionella jordanis]RMX05131.1 ClpXP protease specificity-enhancing factor [Legionella jordanis]RMX17387.1 ClpXP protease specificity-enhancing factor [Legionella jordanis]VEH13501.1 stringent starvation protein B [Legionella jordanis]HAT8714418.1 ClpXP protease specificity-enhancing factor [Legionella jordanis]
MMMTSNKPYLIRAVYDWIVDNDKTPYILVNANYPGVQVPLEYVNDGRIVLNISPRACRGLHLENDRIVFTARFSGESIQIFVVPAAVQAIYAKENGQGMEFGEDPFQPPPPPSTKAGLEAKGRKPALTLVKKEK